MPEPPILDYDRTGLPKVSPTQLTEPHPAMPLRCVLCFFADAVRALGRRSRVITRLKLTPGEPPVLALRQGGQRVGLVRPGFGAPMAAISLEELIALGARQFIIVGDAGLLAEGPPVVIAADALRDEGTSYHYLPAAPTVGAHPAALAALSTTLEGAGVAYQQGTTWTTDAPFRETGPLVRQRAAAGCLTVEMEAAALYAVAKHRGVAAAALLGASDDLSGERWAWLPGRESARLRLAGLAVAAAAAL